MYLRTKEKGAEPTARESCSGTRGVNIRALFLAPGGLPLQDIVGGAFPTWTPQQAAFLSMSCRVYGSLHKQNGSVCAKWRGGHRRPCLLVDAVVHQQLGDQRGKEGDGDPKPKAAS